MPAKTLNVFTLFALQEAVPAEPVGRIGQALIACVWTPSL